MTKCREGSCAGREGSAAVRALGTPAVVPPCPTQGQPFAGLCFDNAPSTSAGKGSLKSPIFFLEQQTEMWESQGGGSSVYLPITDAQNDWKGRAPENRIPVRHLSKPVSLPGVQHHFWSPFWTSDAL